MLIILFQKYPTDIFILFNRSQLLKINDLVSNLEKYYTIKLQCNTDDYNNNAQTEELENIKNSNLIVCFIERDFLSCKKSFNLLKFALNLRKEIFLIQNDNEPCDVSLIENMSSETETYPRWIRSNDLKNLRKIFNVRLRQDHLLFNFRLKKDFCLK